MIKVDVRVPERRDRAGFVRITDGVKTLAEDAAAATSAFADRRNGANAEHPPFGRYELVALASAPDGAESEYGARILLFEPIAGPALDAESRGRFGVLVYSGAPGGDALLRRTQGGVRLARRAMGVLLEHLREDTEVELELGILTPPPWWAFWRRSKNPALLSKDPPRYTAPSYDEEAIASQMLRSTVRQQRVERRVRDDREDRWRDEESTSPGSRQSATDFRGGGGSGGGGGASGTWGDAPAPGRGPGVNAAGVIVGAAGIAAVASVAAAAEHDSRSDMSNAPEDGSGADDSASSDAQTGSSETDSGSTSY